MKEMSKDKKILNAAESSEFVKKFVAVPKYEVVASAEEIKMKAPLVLKILSKDALHKTEVNGVRLVMQQEAVKPAFDELLGEVKEHNLQLDGIFVQEFLKGIETIVGLKKDPVFGHMILFGLGGVFTEVIADTSTRKCPITMKDAGEMISELKSSRIFKGFRGMKTNVSDLKKTLVSISKLPLKHPEIEELDVNPFTLTDKKGFAVDVRVIEA